MALDQGLTWKDFKIETDRRGSNFYYPRDFAVSKLDQAGLGADSLVVSYLDRDLELKEAYRLFAENLLEKIQTPGKESFTPFVMEFPARV